MPRSRWARSPWPGWPSSTRTPSSPRVSVHRDGGPEMAPIPPDARAIPAKPWRLSLTRSLAAPRRPHTPRRSLAAPRDGPIPPDARATLAKPWRLSLTRQLAAEYLGDRLGLEAELE